MIEVDPETYEVRADGARLTCVNPLNCPADAAQRYFLHSRARLGLGAGRHFADPIDEVLIDFDRRHRRRIVLTTQTGRELLIDFRQVVRLRDGDGLALEDGNSVRVRARPEPLLEIRGA